MKCGARSLWWQVPEYENRPVECVQARARARRRRRCGFVCWLSSCLALVSHLSRELSRRCLFKRELCGAIVPTGMCDFVRKCKSTSNELCGFDKRSAASVVRERPVLTTSMNPRHMTTSSTYRNPTRRPLGEPIPLPFCHRTRQEKDVPVGHGTALLRAITSPPCVAAPGTRSRYCTTAQSKQRGLSD